MRKSAHAQALDGAVGPVRPRVVQVSQPTTEGVAVYVRDLAAAGVRAGFDVGVACPAEGLLPDWVVAAGAEWIPMPLVRQPTPADLRNLLALRSVFRGSDVVHLHSSKAGAVGRMAIGTLRRRPRCVFTPNAWSWSVGGRFAGGYRVLERVLARVPDVIVAVSEEERQLGTAALGKSLRRIEVIENGVDVDRFTPGGSRAPRTDAPLLVCAGRLSDQKAQDTAIRALAEMFNSNAVLRLVGDGPNRVELEQLADALNVRSRVEFAGNTDDVGPHLRAADIVVVPSRWDGLSFVLLEAMACGAPIIATDVARSVVADAGLLVPVDEPQAIARFADHLLADPVERRELGALARARAVERYSLDLSMQRTVALWHELAHARNPSRMTTPRP